MWLGSSLVVCGAKVVEKGRFVVDRDRLRKAADNENGVAMVNLGRLAIEGKFKG